MENEIRIKRLMVASSALVFYIIGHFLIYLYTQKSSSQRLEYKAAVASLSARVHGMMTENETSLLIQTLEQLDLGGPQPLLGLSFTASSLNDYLGKDKFDVRATAALLEQSQFEAARAKLELLSTKVSRAQAREFQILRYLAYLGLAGAILLAMYVVYTGIRLRRHWSNEITVFWSENPPLEGSQSFEDYLQAVVEEEVKFTGHRAKLTCVGLRVVELPSPLSNIVEQLIEQLTRNSVEHGGRPPEQRVMAGKTDNLNILVSIDQSDSSYYVSVRDDGEGLDAQEIVRRAADLGLISHQEANSLPVNQAARIIFLPEFHSANRPVSQAENDQSLSELRMLVKTVGGVFSIQNQLGHYCQFIVSFPKDKLAREG